MYVYIIRLIFIGFMNEITHDMINMNKCYCMKTMNSTAKGYFHSCRFPYASRCVLELQVSLVATDMGTATLYKEDIC